MSYRIYVYAISKNEEAFVDRFMDSMEEADGVIVTDTGSTDETAARLRARGAVVYTEEIMPWRFDRARNRSLEHVPEDADICVCTDLDEVLEKGWRKHLETAWTPEAQQGNYLYNWSVKPDGTPGTQMIYFKVHTRKNFVWEYPVHECLRYTGPGTPKKVFIPGMVLNHYPDPKKSRDGYLELLRLGAEEMPQDSRMAYYLGREYMYLGQWETCAAQLKRYLDLTSAVWKEERCAAMRWIAKSEEKQGRKTEALSWYFRAVGEAPGMRDAYVECALAAYRWEEWSLCLGMAEQAMKIEKKSDCFTNAAYAWDETVYDLAAIAAFHLKSYELSAGYAKAAVEKNPTDQRLLGNLELIRKYCGSGK